MSWAEKRLSEYKRGRKATFFEKRLLEHAEPVHATLAIIGVIVILYGLWLHQWSWIIGGLVLNLIGHIYSWVR